MPTLFVLLPAEIDVDAFVAAAVRPPFSAAPRRYPRADDAAHLRSVLRDSRDPVATRWLRGMSLAIGFGLLLGATVNGVLAGAFGMLGGLLEVAVPLGAVLGAFLGGFTAAMAGTQVARAELGPLVAAARGGDTLLQWTSPDASELRGIGEQCMARGLQPVVVD